MSIQTGSVLIGSWPDHPITVDSVGRVEVKFTKKFSSIPKIHTGLTTIDNQSGKNTRISAAVENISNRGFVIVVLSWSDSVTWQVGVDWIATDFDNCLCERHDQLLLNDGKQRNCTKVRFTKPFSRAPDVSAAIVKIDTDHRNNLRAKVFAENITTRGFDLIAETWSDTIVYGLSASWIATTHPQLQTFPEQCIPYCEASILPVRLEFHGSSVPQVFKAFSLLDTQHDRNIRVRLQLDDSSLSAEGCSLTAETWNDSITYSTWITVIAVVDAACAAQFVDATTTRVHPQVAGGDGSSSSTSALRGKVLPSDYINLGKIASVSLLQCQICINNPASSCFVALNLFRLMLMWLIHVQGWWGTTYRAKHRVDDNEYCVKHIHHDRHKHWQLLKTELRNLTMLPYQENIVRYHHSTIFEDQLFIVTELVRGHQLAEEVRNRQIIV